jgi:hypothetical protein
LIISFNSAWLEQVCCRLEAAESAFGALKANALVTTIAELESLSDASEMLAFFNGAITQIDDSLSLEIGPNHQATFVAAGTKFGKDQAGAVIWSTVKRLKLVKLT